MIEITNVSMVFDNNSGRLFGKKAPENSQRREKALDDISLTVPEGCIYGFLGSNGAGKSTLMRMMCGVYKTPTGSIKLDGKDIFDDPEAKKNIFFVNDETVEYTSYTLKTLMSYYSCYYDTFDCDTYRRLLNVLALPENVPLSSFSKGMKRQAVSVIGLSCRTKYLMLDEAFDGLDPAMRNVIKNMIFDEIKSRSASLIISSHNIREIGDLCDSAMLLSEGKLVFADRLSNIKSRFRKLQLVSLSHVITPDEINAAGIGIINYTAEGKVVRAIVRDECGLDERISSVNADLSEQIPLSLEEIFIYETDMKGYGK